MKKNICSTNGLDHFGVPSPLYFFIKVDQPPRHPADATPLFLCSLGSLSESFRDLGCSCLSVGSGVWLYVTECHSKSNQLAPSL